MMSFILAVFGLFEDTLAAAWELEALRFFAVALLFFVLLAFFSWLMHTTRRGL